MPSLIVHVSVEHPNAVWGGIGTAIDLLVRAATEEATPTAVLTPLNSALVPALEHPVQDIRTSHGLINGPGDFYYAADRLALGAIISEEMTYLLRRLSTQNALQVIIHNEEFLPLIRALRGARSIDVVYFSHGLAKEEHPGQSRLWDLQRDVHLEAPQIAVASTAQSEAVLEISGRQAFVINLPLAHFVDQEISNKPLPNEILAAGRFVRQKGFDILIKALDMIESPPLCRIIAGHGDAEYERECRGQARDKSIDIVWLPWNNAADLRASLTRTSCLIMPSRFEPLGLLAAESIGLGTPVIGSDVGGLSLLLRAASQVAVPTGVDGPHVQELAQAIVSRTSRRITVQDRRSLEVYNSDRTLANLDSLIRAGEPES
ncbi:glycosyltransferase family 4 protein [Arthrobacter sp. CDRTa11]|uniref:glycosyltransferase family 4 protein n=1 Tax=Arthrobacter sp. CDRTa11 TaxID=2651199 RepID=UPI002265E40E|nr:glycosyltransferase family 4 protein [Arthrobacter sp. CDRTa11]UZX02820.1 glycosyltransferase family 4 protein [Arthrobacter sp. CDRTa11]